MENIEVSFTPEQQCAIAQIVAKAVSDAVAKVFTSGSLQLDNGITQNQNGLDSKEEPMASKCRKNYTYIDMFGEQQTVKINGSTEKECDLKYQKMLTEIANGIMPKQHKCPTFAEFVEKKYRPDLMNGLKPTTVSNYEFYLRKYIIPYFGDTKLVDISVDTVQKFRDWLANGSENGFQQDIVADTITRVCGLCGRIFNYAVELKIAKESPFKSMVLKNNGKTSVHHKALPDTEIERIIKAIPNVRDRRHRLFLALLACTGMRREEILGLRWEDIDLDGEFAKINQVVTFPDQNQPHIDTPKTECSDRYVHLTDPLLTILKESYFKTGFVIGNSKPLGSTAFGKMQKKAFAEVGITNFTNHDFRATFGTRLKENGMSSAQVADLMGHADTRMVEKVYAPRRKDGILKQRNAVEALNTFA